jgi:hypothetical protein
MNKKINLKESNEETIQFVSNPFLSLPIVENYPNTLLGKKYFIIIHPMERLFK